jgi:hypothetical protein
MADFSLTYNGNGNSAGSAPTDPASPRAGGSTVTALACPTTLVKNGFVFSHWNTAANGSGTSVNAAGTFTMPAGATVLYAQWVVTYAAPVAPVNIVIPQGDLWEHEFSVLDVNGLPIQIQTGFTVQFQARPTLDGDPVIELDETDTGNLVIAAGKVTLKFTAVESQALDFGGATCFYGLKISRTDWDATYGDRVEEVAWGRITLRETYVHT